MGGGDRRLPSGLRFWGLQGLTEARCHCLWALWPWAITLPCWATVSPGEEGTVICTYTAATGLCRAGWFASLPLPRACGQTEWQTIPLLVPGKCTARSRCSKRLTAEKRALIRQLCKRKPITARLVTSVSANAQIFYVHASIQSFVLKGSCF